MKRNTILCLAQLAFLAICCSANKDTVNSDLVNTKVQRTIDLTTHLPKISNIITLENTGKSSVRSFLVAIDSVLSGHVSYISAVIKSSDEDKKLSVKKTAVANQQGKTFYRVDLASSLDAGKSLKVNVDAAFSHTLRPYPQQIAQAEKQFMRFQGNVYFYSPYKTTTQTSTVKCTSSKIEDYTKVKPVSNSDNTITYGPYENKAPFAENEMTIHYENNGPFLTVTEMVRVIEVSHWGNVAVEETYDIAHSGAILKGSFSRYDYQRQQDGVSSVKSFKTILPAAARDVYYRDEIGNISTSHLKELDDAVELELRPRFPLFGGWKTHYYIGYNVPSYQYLFNNGDQYVLKMRFVDHVFDDQVIDKCSLKVILPEGAKNIEMKTPFEVERSDNEQHYTYLDTVGRPVVNAKKTDLVEQHIQDFELHYTFPKLMLLQEPLLAVGAFYLLFMIIIIYVRMDFSITKDEASESRMRVASLIEQVQIAQDRRSALYQSYEDAINKFKSSKDSTSFTTNRKKIDGDYKQLTQQISSLQAKLKQEGSETAEKIAELQRSDTQVKDQIHLSITSSEKLISGKFNKQQYLDYEATLNSKKEDLFSKMDGILASL